MSGCGTCGGFGMHHDPVAHGAEPEEDDRPCICGHDWERHDPEVPGCIECRCVAYVSAKSSPGIADFLLARIAEDEAVARKATQGNAKYPRWRAEPNMRIENGCRCLSCEEPSGSWDVYPIDGPDCDMHGCFHTMTIGEADAQHIARHDPARVLAECDAKRWIVARYEDEPWQHILRALALPYADHSDYREEWAV